MRDPRCRVLGAAILAALFGVLLQPAIAGDPTGAASDMAEPIPIGLQVATSARLPVVGQNCHVKTGDALLVANLSVVVDGMLQLSGQHVIAREGEGRTRITFEGETLAKSSLRFTVIVDGGKPQVVRAVPVEGQFSAVVIVTPPVVTFTTGPRFELSGPGFALQLGERTVSTGPWTLTAIDATILNRVISPDFPLIGWTARIQAQGEPTLTFANVSECDFTGTGQRDTVVRSGYLDIKPGSYPNPINPSSDGAVPVAVLGSANFDVRVIDAATIEIDDDRIPGGGVAPTRVSKSFEDVNGDGFPDLSLRFGTQVLDKAGLLGNKRLFVTGAVGNSAADVLGSDAICLPASCAQ